MLGRLPTLLSAVSLALCAAACVLWVRSRSIRLGGFGEPLCSVRVTALGGRHTATVGVDGLAIWSPPVPAEAVAAAPPARRPLPPEWVGAFDPFRAAGVVFAPPGTTPAALAARVSNDQVTWEIRHTSRSPWDGRTYEPHFAPRGVPGSATQTFAPYYGADGVEIYDGGYGLRETDPALHQPFTGPQAARALLDALDDPARWVAAHVILTRLYDPAPPFALRHGDGTVEPGPDGMLVQAFYGLRVELRPRPGGREYADHPNPNDTDYYRVRTCDPVIDPAQQAVIRDRWHRRLDVRVAAAPWWATAAGTGLLPVCQGLSAAATRRWHRSRARDRRCTRCGYDLRATPGHGGALLDRCPECGAAPAGGT